MSEDWRDARNHEAWCSGPLTCDCGVTPRNMKEEDHGDATDLADLNELRELEPRNRSPIIGSADRAPVPNDPKACTICGDTEPFHVHNEGERIENYFTVGRGQTDFEAAQAWKRKWQAVAKTMSDISTVTGSDLVPAAQEALDKTFPETPMPEFPSSFAGLAAAFKNGDRARLRKALLATQREAVEPWRKFVEAYLGDAHEDELIAWAERLLEGKTDE